MIDNAISSAASYKEFLEIMDGNIEVRFGNSLAFKFPKQERFTRLSRLGLDYSENSIKYRIENKTIHIAKLPEVKQLIDKSDEQYQGKDKAGLRHWATTQNIEVLADMSHTMHMQNITSDQYQARQQSSLSRL